MYILQKTKAMQKCPHVHKYLYAQYDPMYKQQTLATDSYTAINPSVLYKPACLN